MTYEELLIEADKNNLITKEKPLRANKGRIKGNRIAIQRDLSQNDKACVLAEELGHYYTSVGDIIDQTDTSNRKQERVARLWSYNKMIGLQGIIDAHKNQCTSKHEIIEFLGVTEDFFDEAIKTYTEKYGVCTQLDNYLIFFIPNLGVMELI